VRRNLKEVSLQLLLSAFPGGIAGISLLVLRAVLGVAVAAEGAFYIWGPGASISAWCLGITAIASGAMLVFGFLTPFVGLLVGVGAVALLLSLLPVCTPNVFDSKPALIFALTMLFTVVGAGPGRYSVDARMFGRREIIIPPRGFQLEQ
jgi:uncharacterized membrane protein YphA (DoxX/SURF4 family)